MPAAQRARLLIGKSTNANRSFPYSGNDACRPGKNRFLRAPTRANSLPAVDGDVAAIGNCGALQSNATKLVHFLVTSGTSLARHQLPTK